VGLGVLLVSGALSVALLDTPSADRVRTEEGTDDLDGGLRSEGRRAPGGRGSGTTVDDGDRGGVVGGSSTRGGGRGGRRQGRDRDRGDKSNERERPSGRGPGGGGSSTTVTTPPPTGEPGSLLVEPSGTLPAMAPVGLAPDRPCPPGTAVVEVRITATGGPLDGDAGSDGVWASASCLDRSDGRPVWRHTLVPLESP